MKRLKYFVKERKFGLSLLLLLLLVVEIGKASATLTATIDVKSSFKLNETVFFTYTIISDKDMEIKYIPLIVCENAPVPLLKEKTINLKKDIPFTRIYYSFTVTEEIEPQKCQAILEIVGPSGTKRLFSKSFNIVTKPSFEVKILTCKDLECKQQSRVFVKGEPIYVWVLTQKRTGEPLTNVSLELNYITPSKIKKSLSFPKNEGHVSKQEVNLYEAGTYNLEAIAFKPGYKIIKRKIQIGIIKREPKIKLNSIPKQHMTPLYKKIIESELTFSNRIKKFVGAIIGFIIKKFPSP